MKIILLVCLFITFKGISQDTLVAKINSEKLEYDSLIYQSQQEELDFYPPKFVITSTLMERAIGEVSSTTELFFDVIENEEYDRDSCLLRQVKVTIESGSYLIAKTYFFNALGDLIYYQIHEEGYDCWEQTYYFDNICIYKTQKALPTENCNLDVIAETFSKSTLSLSEIEFTNSILKTSNQYKNQLRLMYNMR